MAARDALTHVELTHIEKRVENWVRFGHEAQEQILDRRRRIFSFRPGSVFAFVRWAANDFGTIASRIDILRTVAPGESCQKVPFVRPGAEILLRVAGWPKVEQVLRHIDAVEDAGIDACVIVDRLFAAAELRLGDKHSEQRVRIVRTDGRKS